MSDGGRVWGLDTLWDFGEGIWGSRCPTRFWRRFFGVLGVLKVTEEVFGV